MRLRVVYRIAKVPLDYRAAFVSLIKEAVEQADAEVFKTVYKDAARLTKPFCFSVFFPDFKIDGDIIEIGSLTYLNISMLDFFRGTDTDARVSLALFNGLRSSKLEKFAFPLEVQLTRVHTQLLDEKPPEYFSSGIARFKTMSPILLTSGEKNGARPVLHPATKDIKRSSRPRDNAVFDADAFNESLAMSLKGHVTGGVYFEPEELKVEVVRHSIGKSRQQSGKPLKLVVGFSGRFALKGAPADLHRIYQTGLGFKRNQGFGMLEVG